VIQGGQSVVRSREGGGFRVSYIYWRVWRVSYFSGPLKDAGDAVPGGRRRRCGG